jgi:hypothetical protein
LKLIYETRAKSVLALIKLNLHLFYLRTAAAFLSFSPVDSFECQRERKISANFTILKVTNIQRENSPKFLHVKLKDKFQVFGANRLLKFSQIFRWGCQKYFNLRGLNAK